MRWHCMSARQHTSTPARKQTSILAYDSAYDLASLYLVCKINRILIMQKNRLPVDQGPGCTPYLHACAVFSSSHRRTDTGSGCRFHAQSARA